MSDNQEIRRLLFIASSYLSDGSVAYPVTAGEIARSNALDAVMRVRNLLAASPKVAVVEPKDCRAEFDAIAPKHGITVERFKQRPDDYKYEHAVAMYKLWQDAWNAALPPQPINHTGGHP